MKLRVRATATAVLIAGFALCAPAAPAMAETSVSTPVGEVPVSDVAVAVQTESVNVNVHTSPTVPPAPPTRQMVPYEINIIRTWSGTVVAHDFPANEWTCTQSAVATMNPFTVTCTPVADIWECVAMPVYAQALAANWSVRGQVGCTDSISTGWTRWPSPQVGVSTSLGDAPVVTCVAEGRSDIVRLPLAEASSSSSPSVEPLPVLSPRVLDSIVVAPVPDIDAVTVPSTTLHTVKCGPDPYVP